MKTKLRLKKHKYDEENTTEIKIIKSQLRCQNTTKVTEIQLR